jgi:hypothetical protein
MDFWGMLLSCLWWIVVHQSAVSVVSYWGEWEPVQVLPLLTMMVAVCDWSLKATGIFHLDSAWAPDIGIWVPSMLFTFFPLSFSSFIWTLSWAGMFREQHHWRWPVCLFRSTPFAMRVASYFVVLSWREHLPGRWKCCFSVGHSEICFRREELWVVATSVSPYKLRRGWKPRLLASAQLQFDDGICSAWVYINVVSIVAADSIPYSGLHGEFFLFARGQNTWTTACMAPPCYTLEEWQLLQETAPRLGILDSYSRNLRWWMAKGQW